MLQTPVEIKLHFQTCLCVEGTLFLWCCSGGSGTVLAAHLSRGSPKSAPEHGLWPGMGCPRLPELLLAGTWPRPLTWRRSWRSWPPRAGWGFTGSPLAVLFIPKISSDFLGAHRSCWCSCEDRHGRTTFRSSDKTAVTSWCLPWRAAASKRLGKHSRTAHMLLETMEVLHWYRGSQVLK